MSPSKDIEFLQILKSRIPLITISFICLFTFILLLNTPLKSNPLNSTTHDDVSTLTSHVYTISNFTTTTTTPAISSLPNTSNFDDVTPLDEYIVAPSPAANSIEDDTASLMSFSPTESSSCDMFDGTWVYDDETDPIYALGSCPYVGESFNCFRSGRPDFSYIKYRWQPYGCDVPRFDGKKMMEILRGKTMVFMGDSLNRNMWDSLLCSLGAFNISGQKIFKRHEMVFHIKDYECNIIMITAPFLVQDWKIPGLSDKQTPVDRLRLDAMHGAISKHANADFLIFNTAHWWNHGRTKFGDHFFQEGDVVIDKMDLEEAHEKAINTWAKWVDENVNKDKTSVFFMGYTAVHYKGGEWYSNGTCHREKEPIKDTEPIHGQVLEPYPWLMKSVETMFSKMKTPVTYLDIAKLTNYRKDGHPSRYRRPHSSWRPGQPQDCMHWCLPGVPDSWNQLLYASLLQSSKQFDPST